MFIIVIITDPHHMQIGGPARLAILVYIFYDSNCHLNTRNYNNFSKTVI
jgi:hypothetical protein